MNDVDPVTAARAWLQLVLVDGDVDAAWQLTDADYRHRAAESWVTENRDHPDLKPHAASALIAEFSRPRPTHPLWAAMAASFLKAWRRNWQDLDFATLGWFAAPRPVSVDHEVALATRDLSGPVVPVVTEEGQELEVYGFLMHRVDDAWLLAEVRIGQDAYDWPLRAR